MYSAIRFAAVSTLVCAALGTCYFPNGDVSASDTACDSSATDSACCFTGQACLSNGLCVSDPTNTTLARLHRGTCTDRNWNSAKCPGECLDVKDNGVPVYSCNSTSSDEYCCFDNCACNSNFQVFSFSESPADVYTLTIIGNKSFVQTHTSTLFSPSISATPGASSQPSTSLPSSAIAKATGISTTTSAAPSSQNSSSSNTSSNVTAIGVGVGVGVGGALLLGAAAFFFFRRRSQNANPYGDISRQKAVEMDSHQYSGTSPAGGSGHKYAQHAESQLSPGSADAPVAIRPQQVFAAELPEQPFAPVELPAHDTLPKMKG